RGDLARRPAGVHLPQRALPEVARILLHRPGLAQDATYAQDALIGHLIPDGGEDAEHLGGVRHRRHARQKETRMPRHVPWICVRIRPNPCAARLSYTAQKSWSA